MADVAALYVDPRGPYPKIDGVDCWDESRDARAYPGPFPIVAHPPCGAWGRLKHLHKREQDRELAPFAVAQVRRFGGVLEHPAESHLFRRVGSLFLPLPGELSFCDGFTVEVDQCEWGHVARKRTWLYCVGVPRAAIEKAPYPGREPTHWISGGRGTRGGRSLTTPVPPGIKVASARQRRRTPALFAQYLVRLARAAGAQRRAA